MWFGVRHYEMDTHVRVLTNAATLMLGAEGKTLVLRERSVRHGIIQRPTQNLRHDHNIHILYCCILVHCPKHSFVDELMRGTQRFLNTN